MTITDLITDALTEIRVARAGDVPSPEDLALGLLRYNRILDRLNVDQSGTWNVNFLDPFTLQVDHQPHTLGPTGDWVIARRPQRILGANVIIGSGTSALFPSIQIVDDQWWRNNPVPNLQSSWPLYLYYSPDWTQDGTPVNGSCFFWPVPTTAYQVRLEVAVTFGAAKAADTFSLPPGYQDLLTLLLAESLAPSFGQSLSPSQALALTKAQARVFGRTVRPQAVVSRDSGMPGGSPSGSDYTFWEGPLSFRGGR